MEKTKVQISIALDILADIKLAHLSAENQKRLELGITALTLLELSLEAAEPDDELMAHAAAIGVH